jgi:hypothetical protein
MALKDIWTDRKNGVDDVNAEDINIVAQAVIALENNYGEISTALDELHEYAQALVSGGISQ